MHLNDKVCVAYMQFFKETVLMKSTIGDDPVIMAKPIKPLQSNLLNYLSDFNDFLDIIKEYNCLSGKTVFEIIPTIHDDGERYVAVCYSEYIQDS